MSIESVSKQVTPFFDQLPDDPAILTFEFLKQEKGALTCLSDDVHNDRSIMKTVSVCRNWRDSPLLQKERKGAETRLRQRDHFQAVLREMSILSDYHPMIWKTFEKSGYPISQLPVLDLGDRQGWTDYIDFLTAEDMTYPVMRFKDCFDRPGIALHIHRRGQKKGAVLALFQRTLNNKDRWALGSRNDYDAYISNIRGGWSADMESNEHQLGIISELLSDQNTYYTVKSGRGLLTPKVIIATGALGVLAIAYLANLFFNSQT